MTKRRVERSQVPYLWSPSLEEEELSYKSSLSDARDIGSKLCTHLLGAPIGKAFMQPRLGAPTWVGPLILTGEVGVKVSAHGWGN